MAALLNRFSASVATVAAPLMRALPKASTRTACGCGTNPPPASTIKSLLSHPARTSVVTQTSAVLGALPQSAPLSSGFETDVTTETPDIADLFARNRKWVGDMTKDDPEYFDKLGAVHNPDYLWIGCSDARVPANEIIGLGAGEVFVHRNVANMVVATDLNIMSVLQYAVEVLKVKHIIVAGHYECGGVKASMTQEDHGLIESWLSGVRDVYRLHKDELDAIEDEEQRYRRLVELNVVEQCLHVFKTGVVQRQRIKTYKERDGDGDFATPRIHAMVFDPKDGILRKLPVNFKEVIANYRNIYDLYDAPK